ncbi:MAG: MBL fold metallo-hydrolase, partial [Nitrososphaeraceae archaeon]|nr:MBL fold metallo-hydrolase [Nitrososphaeraceae archaeon]
MSLIDKKKEKLPNTPFTIHGHSVAAKGTCFYIPEMRIMLDCGIESDYLPEHVFVTHLHSDHSKAIPVSIIQLTNAKFKQNNKKIDIYVPEEMKEYVRNYIDAFYVMSKNNKFHKAHSKYNLIGVKTSMRIETSIRNTRYIIEIIKCHHTVPCVGYGFIEVRKRLKEEYKLLSNKEIAGLRKSGVDVQEDFEVPQFCYLGDTTEQVFKEPEWKKYNTIMVECTFLEDDMIDYARVKKHMHIQNLLPIIKLYSNKTFILYHFSFRYDKDNIHEYF